MARAYCFSLGSIGATGQFKPIDVGFLLLFIDSKQVEVLLVLGTFLIDEEDVVALVGWRHFLLIRFGLCLRLGSFFEVDLNLPVLTSERYG